MLHRLTLRVLPSLNAAVTEASVRRRKRWVMLIPGLVAFVVYRLFKLVFPLSDPFLLIGACGGFSTLAALWAYRMGRSERLATVIREDGFKRVGWLMGWIGFVYGVQLSLLVLALLYLFVDYNFLVHPDGPAMMALIISCTAVSRDAFEIGHIRRLEHQGGQIVTFPDGRAFRRMARMEPVALAQWTIFAAAGGIGVSLALALFGEFGRGELAQTLIVSVAAACLGYAAYLMANSHSGNWILRLKSLGWAQGLRFWAWPCFTFAMTYYLVQVGIFTFLLKVNVTYGLAQTFLAGTTAGLMACYCYYLGNRAFVESQTLQGIPENLRSCPFVMKILTQTGIVSDPQDKSPANLEAGQPQKTS